MCLDASRPWLCYWIVHSLMLLDEPIPESVASSVCQFLGQCQGPNGGFAGGPSQQPHLAPTYAAVNALCTIGTEEAYNVINRSAYCAASVASLTNIMTPKLFDGTAEWIARVCQCPSPEGANPYSYYCGSVSCDVLQEKAFTGHSPLSSLQCVTEIFVFTGESTLSYTNWMFDQKALQEYILLCCQCPSGGLLDKPGKSRDFYHTCYCLSGLSIAQHFGSGEMLRETVVGSPENILKPTHPVYNIGPDKVAQAIMHFMQKEIPDLNSKNNDI
ncbi:hypothetical protein AB205_0168840 [Aquarana catesbeiana]|uniref:Prenyltransferase alpha-alpha toroid domain-containing protein n=1 Tax=Aquarana catesbeiana TaxID=8400 RepID=A0A2G9S8G5_AQUCT|nr:hypothetical protein AB205_0168840 [Aquarana catesbeiana]